MDRDRNRVNMLSSEWVGFRRAKQHQFVMKILGKLPLVVRQIVRLSVQICKRQMRLYRFYLHISKSEEGLWVEN